MSQSDSGHTSLPNVLPRSRVADPMAAPPLRWGVLGTGWVAERFVLSLHRHTRQRVVAVGSRSGQRAADFARPFGLHRAYGGYDAVVSDEAVDVVYVATPHNLHVDLALMALDAGKHVLIEKPIALASHELDLLRTTAERKGLLVQEAFWTFFLPKFDVIRQLLDDGALGQMRMLMADHCEWFPSDHRMHDPSLAGGSLNDLGVYPLALAAWVLGEAETARGSATWTDRGVPGDVAVILQHSAGGMSCLATTLHGNSPGRATLIGSEGSISTEDDFMMPGGFSVEDTRSRRRLRYDEPNIRHQALHFQAAEVARTIGTGRSSTVLWDLEHSAQTLRALELVARAVTLSPIMS